MTNRNKHSGAAHPICSPVKRQKRGSMPPPRKTRGLEERKSKTSREPTILGNPHPLLSGVPRQRLPLLLFLPSPPLHPQMWTKRSPPWSPSFEFGLRIKMINVSKTLTYEK